MDRTLDYESRNEGSTPLVGNKLLGSISIGRSLALYVSSWEFDSPLPERYKGYYE